MKQVAVLTLIAGLMIAGYACTRQDNADSSNAYTAIRAKFGTRIDPDNLLNYANQAIPGYINKDNTRGNAITNAKATLGRVLFYDKNLSIDNSISCGSCHKQAFAFGDNALVSAGVQSGMSARHSMRLVNSRFSDEVRFFWDERAATLEAQTTRPIQDHAEMGFSGQNGRPDINALIQKLSAIDYYKELFQFVYGNATITEQRMQECLAGFIRSIQSFDSKYDLGKAVAGNDNNPFPNFTAQENQGKQLFLQPPQFDAGGSRIAGGAGCQGCHRAPEFDIDPNTRNNGITGKLNNGPGAPELTNTKSPTLRDAVSAAGNSNGAFMHSGVFTSLENVIGHYNNIVIAAGNTNLDPRLTPGGNGQRLNLTPAEINAIAAFIRTLSGTNVYRDVKWSDPF
ncbi:MAG: cytochrome-c peroxidase [Sphingobacteriales bacterium SCN 48-20]|uniref:cytochrome-c peroxidase n=1 Tax=Terrimonas ferruginea TaxID=249 RepID=UPI00086D3D8F|nr:cytochrome-c peroxidase [Terrimonas ferruginea]MBN8782163.1 hypothetical protein [Terrimonas ferruginea]ODT95594.1 MAG: cytochrome-c peroxidase [Sphingobacteriales bacterium SCN 48-20]OJW42700.1 MAG: cytochrome-c peroxidase [Sphingobacteriales bacterium 48-107]